MDIILILLIAFVGFISGYILAKRTIYYNMAALWKAEFLDSQDTLLNIDLILTYIIRLLGVKPEQYKSDIDKLYKELYEKTTDD